MWSGKSRDNRIAAYPALDSSVLRHVFIVVEVNKIVVPNRLESNDDRQGESCINQRHSQLLRSAFACDNLIRLSIIAASALGHKGLVNALAAPEKTRRNYAGNPNNRKCPLPIRLHAFCTFSRPYSLCLLPSVFSPLSSVVLCAFVAKSISFHLCATILQLFVFPA